MSPKITDSIERLFWTFVAAFLGQLVGTAVLDLGVSAIQSAAIASECSIAGALLTECY